VESYGWPEAEQYDYAQARELAATVSPTYAVRGPYWRPIFAQACEMLGIERMLGVMMDEPARAEAIFRCVHAVQRAYCERFVAACGEHLDVFYLGDDFATQNGLMMPPDLWRQFLMPLYADLFSIGKQAGKYVWFHSCGDITEVLGDLIDIGMDLWETVQLHALPMPARELKREYGGAVAFFGGVSTQHIPFDTPERVRERTVAAIEALGAGGGYICGPDHHVKPDVPPANAVALFEAARSFRGEGYTLDS
jgi:uroporphyrinogen decarboxylase